jgi:hypothetical protein
LNLKAPEPSYWFALNRVLCCNYKAV